MKRSGNVSLVLMGAATFAATFAAGTAYMAWSKPAGAGQSVAQTCTTRADGSQDCQPRPRSYSYYLFPSHGWWSWGRSADTARPQSAALTNSNSVRTYSAVPASSTARSGFGSTARSFSRVSVGG